ncbi:orotidine-5'-phosphate decarboxylase [uncultured Thiothrix sp.]|uniref:orotidine-5'-phosphate decarboxylase n=1 Tax=uncultured Thiothrix sp. TaxID=223185 RepID=UPI002604C865|nr:orotidine-5'-phosphate decarboxylase [uncultured Thiothrix sp.]HMT92666.1 orotidine-5'-phosphate decarboxylase [Thiolinea sp.]
MTNRLIIALDFPAAEPAISLVKQLSPNDCKLKVGFELFVAAGPNFVRQLVTQGFDVFLDLKFHDIPNTVAAACKSAADLGVWMVNVHAAGGDQMMLAARDALAGFQQPPKLIAVTVLTSMDKAQLEKINIIQSPVEQVSHLAVLTKQCGLDGIVCSAQEAPILKQACGSDFLLVTPGIRPLGSQQDDQSRVVTPLAARQLGIDYVVVGRPITRAKDPLAIIAAINQDLT